nr:major head protein [Microvirus sp.]
MLAADFGQLIPFDVREVVPGDVVSINASSSTRTVPLNSASFTRFREHMDYYFVPYRLLWRFSDAALVKVPNNNSATSPNPVIGEQIKELPYFSSLGISRYLDKLDNFEMTPDQLACDDGGLDYAYTTKLLLEYLGYGERSADIDNPEYDSPDCCAFRALAYQKIYADYYRNDQWEPLVPYAYNCDYITPESNSKELQLYTPALSPEMSRINYTPLIMRYANYPKDIITGVLPSSQYGGAVYVPVDSRMVTDISKAASVPELKLMLQTDNQLSHPLGVSHGAMVTDTVNIDTVSADIADMDSIPVKSIYNRFNVLALRQAQALQKYREITECHKLDYKHQIKAHFDVNVSDDRSDSCKYLCGNVSNMDLTPVTNTTFTQNEDPIIKGNMTCSNGCSLNNFNVREHGVIMGIYYAEPILDYGDAIAPTLLNVDTESVFQPEFDKLGFEAVSAYAVSSPRYASEYIDNNGSPTIGYLPRYWQYKIPQDRVQNSADAAFPSWTSRVTLEDLNLTMQDDTGVSGYTMSWRTFKVCPFHVNGVFTAQAPYPSHVISTYKPRILLNFSNNCVMVRPMDATGLPY